MYTYIYIIPLIFLFLFILLYNNLLLLTIYLEIIYLECPILSRFFFLSKFIEYNNTFITI